ncbi:malto-oligosyltrehalose synthase [Microbacterium sp.]|uniref:malto-oligosyltrehalose synthase n=1 Tax=Microbacterium sp. TaxID=51671 RepID=UPI0039E3DE32
MADHPVSTYRLQIRQAFDLDAAAEVTGYLRDLGVSWAYLSPILQATSGSDHGYDVVDPTRVDDARGGPEGLRRFAAAARAHGLGILVDIVPNHQGIARPEENPWWWDVLHRGRASAHAVAFDIDWEFGDGTVQLPLLGADLDEVLARRELSVEPHPVHGGVARYYELTLPLAVGTAPAERTDDPDAVREVFARQHWRLRYWRDEASVLNFRRFFAVTSLAGVRVEVPEVFAQTHAEIVRWLREGLADGLRIDHPDGLADPGGYLERLAEATGGAYVVVEKILEHGETLPAWWETDGTTGYDAMAEIDRVLIAPGGAAALGALDTVLRGEEVGYADLIHAAKRMTADSVQAPEVARLVRCLPADVREVLGDDVARDGLAELLTCFPVYRAYLPAGAEYLDQAVAEATEHRPDLAGAILALAPLLAEPGTELSRRFMQTTGPVMAKGVEDTAFYRYTRLGSLTEVGGDPSVFSLDVAGLHDAFTARQARWPHAMTALSTHDTKRGEDVRARLAVLAEVPGRWIEVLGELRAVASSGHGPFDNLLWQAVVGSWPLTPDRLHAYAEKAAREADDLTGWSHPDAEFEHRVHEVVDAAFGPARGLVEAFVAEIAGLGWSNSLSAKLLQLTGPGIPDVYQGSEMWETSLVDPDSRRPVDFDARRSLLARIDGGWMPPVDASGAAKLLVTSRALRLRRDRPDLFTRYTPMTVVGAAAEHAIAFDRGGALAVTTRLPAGLAARGGWGDTLLLRHSGETVDVLTGRRFRGSQVPLADLLSIYPVALLGPAGGPE